MKRLIGALGLALALSLTACGEPTEVDFEESGVEIEDCDAEDRANREAECGFTKKSTKKPADKATTNKTKSKPKSKPKTKKR